jgi:hypothetical protein
MSQNVCVLNHNFQVKAICYVCRSSSWEMQVSNLLLMYLRGQSVECFYSCHCKTSCGRKSKSTSKVFRRVVLREPISCSVLNTAGAASCNCWISRSAKMGLRPGKLIFGVCSFVCVVPRRYGRLKRCKADQLPKAIQCGWLIFGTRTTGGDSLLRRNLIVKQ